MKCVLMQTALWASLLPSAIGFRSVSTPLSHRIQRHSSNVGPADEISRHSRPLFSTAEVFAGATAPVLKSVLKKPSKVVTVGVEYTTITATDDNNSIHSKTTTLSSNELSILSMQLRKSKASSIWCGNVESLRILVEEQATAQGNFPGPLPVIYNGPLEQATLAVEAGASAVVSSWNEKDRLDSSIPGGAGAEIIWKVSSEDEVQQVLQNLGDSSDAAFLISIEGNSDQTNTQKILETIPKSGLAIVTLNPMQAGGAEIEMGRQCKDWGCASVVIQRACVGDGEDLDYAQFLVNGMTSKASSEFKFSGLTGSTNGHFGGVQANDKVRWRRNAGAKALS